MPMWPQPQTPAAERVRELHTSHTGQPPVTVGTAPATWSVLGENTDSYGGLTIMGLSSLRAAAAATPRKDDLIRVTLVSTTAKGGTTKEVTQTSLRELNELAAAQQPTTDAEGQPVFPPAPTGGAGLRAAGLVWMLINRQMLSRDTTGMDITVVNDIPAHAGLGALSAMDVAVALSMLGEGEDLNEAPLRAKLADVCGQAVSLFSALPPLRARHTTALRGAGETVSVIDYADNSVTTAPHPLSSQMRGFILAVPNSEPTDVEALYERQRFVADACRAFGTDNLRLLPDAPQRVVEWLTAVHEVYGPNAQPAVADAKLWLEFFEAETARAQDVARSLRSRRGAELFAALSASQEETHMVYGIDSASQLAQLAQVRGAAGARAASAGIAQAVLALVPADRADNFAADLAADGLDVIELAPGEPANLA